MYPRRWILKDYKKGGILGWDLQNAHQSTLENGHHYTMNWVVLYIQDSLICGKWNAHMQ